MRERLYYVYILASRIGGTLYIGVTNDLVRRAYEHRKKLVKGFTKRYGVGRLVYFEQFGEVGTAIQREKQLVWKIQLIEEKNPNWDDLYPAIAVPLVYWMPAFAGMTMERRIPAFGNDNISG